MSGRASQPFVKRGSDHGSDFFRHEAAGLACHGATSLEGPFGTAASLHFCASTPAVTYGTELFGPMLLKETYVENDIEYRDGQVFVPEGPGTGLNPDWDQINKFTRK